jgi:Ca2+-transporting ATPase
VLSILVGQYDDACSIAAAVLIVGSVAFYQEHKSEESLEALHTLVPPSCHVVRNGNVLNILAEELVPGDIIRLHAGDRIPADGRVLHCSAFGVDESCLTGEADPKDKHFDPLPDLAEHAEITNFHNIVFMGCLVTSGHATVIVVATGVETELGKTSEQMKDIESRRTPLQMKMDDLGKQLSIISMVIIVGICVIGIIQHESVLSMFNIGVSLAVAAIPEGLPICVTVTLALGVMRMAKKNAIIKKLPAVEALGCANFICTDKTGTLTENKMTVMKAFCPALEDSVSFHYYDHNTNRTLDLLKRDENTGKFILPSSSNVLSGGGSGGNDQDSETNPLLNNNNNNPAGSSTTSLRDGRFELRYHGQVIEATRFLCLSNLFDASCLCNNAILSNLTTGAVTGQPTEGALLIAAAKLGFPDRRNRLKRVKENNFSSEVKYMEVIYTEGSGGGEQQQEQQSQLSQAKSHKGTNATSTSPTIGKEISYLKGALEVILPQCVTYLGANGELLLLSSLVIERIQSQSEEMSREGLRVLAVAYGHKQNQLTFCGIVGLMDPLRFGVVDAVHRIQDSGAKVMMITGDSETTAISIARLAGIYDPVTSKSLSGKEIEEMMKSGGGEEALAQIIGDVAVCFRTSPRHKLFIVRALQSRGYVVAMTGKKEMR